MCDPCQPCDPCYPCESWVPCCYCHPCSPCEPLPCPTKKCPPYCPPFRPCRRANPRDVLSDGEIWEKEGIRILFTKPSIPIPEGIGPQPNVTKKFTLCVQFKNEACISADCIEAYCKTNIITECNPLGEEVDYVMERLYHLSQYDIKTQSHYFQVPICATSCTNNHVEFYIKMGDLKVWAPDLPEDSKCTDSKM